MTFATTANWEVPSPEVLGEGQGEGLSLKWARLNGMTDEGRTPWPRQGPNEKRTPEHRKQHSRLN